MINYIEIAAGWNNRFRSCRKEPAHGCIIEALQDKDDRKAYALFKEINAKSAESDEYYQYLDRFVVLTSSENSYVRTRGFCLACAQARWDVQGRLAGAMDRMLSLLNDPKPIVVRQCLAALHEVAIYRPELSDAIRAGIEKIDLSKYKDSMSPLIRKDMDELLKMLD